MKDEVCAFVDCWFLLGRIPTFTYQNLPLKDPAPHSLNDLQILRYANLRENLIQHSNQSQLAKEDILRVLEHRIWGFKFLSLLVGKNDDHPSYFPFLLIIVDCRSFIPLAGQNVLLHHGMNFTFRCVVLAMVHGKQHSFRTPMNVRMMTRKERRKALYLRAPRHQISC